ncbi:hypothetical protein [Rhodococcoides fascians]|uniref:hypothetical protein n=1 Tax=Rhodococcoides fascians TaxID=1828 RepID=UPI00068E8FAB|nr:hypothetical protein [Rhodococcus fascians]
MSRYPKQLRQLLGEVDKHEMTILKDDGLYRHLRFKRPGSSLYWFDIITWPWHLVIDGDLESFHFSREEDMFPWFESSGDINPDYWAEKLRGPTASVTYSPELFKRAVFERFWEDREHRSDRGLENAPLWREIRRDLMDIAEWGEEHVRAALRDFQFDKYVFTDSYDMNFRELDHHYLLSCHAINWGIRKYRAAQAVAA